MISQSACENKVFYNKNEICHISCMKSIDLLGDIKLYTEILVTKNNKRIFYINSNKKYCDLMLPNKIIFEFIINEVENEDIINIVQKLLIFSCHSERKAFFGAYIANPYSIDKITNGQVKLEDWNFSDWDDCYHIHLPSTDDKTICFDISRPINEASLCIAIATSTTKNYERDEDYNLFRWCGKKRHYVEKFKIQDIKDTYSVMCYTNALFKDFMEEEFQGDYCYKLDDKKSAPEYLKNYCDEKKLDYQEVVKFIRSMFVYYSRTTCLADSFEEVEVPNDSLKKYVLMIKF